jgi:hypothetical protein
MRTKCIHEKWLRKRVRRRSLNVPHGTIRINLGSRADHHLQTLSNILTRYPLNYRDGETDVLLRLLRSFHQFLHLRRAHRFSRLLNSQPGGLSKNQANRPTSLAGTWHWLGLSQAPVTLIPKTRLPPEGWAVIKSDPTGYTIRICSRLFGVSCEWAVIDRIHRPFGLVSKRTDIVRPWAVGSPEKTASRSRSRSAQRRERAESPRSFGSADGEDHVGINTLQWRIGSLDSSQ